MRHALPLSIAILLMTGCDRTPLGVEVVLPDNGWQAVALGASHACGITPEGRAACWGDNSRGQIGAPLGGPEPCADIFQEWGCSPRPLIVEGAASLVALALNGHYSCGLTESGDVLCWGGGSPDVREMPTGGRAVQLEAEWSRLCATLDDGTATCWELEGAPEHAVSPLDDPDARSISGPESFRSINLGYAHACALGESGTAYCWGRGTEGQLGIGGMVEFLEEPTPISGSFRFASLSAGWEYTCGLTTAGDAYCWGENEDAQLGAETPKTCVRDVYYSNFCPSPAPLLAAGGLRLSRVAAGFGHTCGIDTSGNAVCWGENRRAELGTESVAERCGARKGSPASACSTSPVLPDRSRRFGRIDVGWGFSCAIAGSGELLCWGSNSSGKLGTLAVPMSESTHVPQKVDLPAAS